MSHSTLPYMYVGIDLYKEIFEKVNSFGVHAF